MRAEYLQLLQDLPAGTVKKLPPMQLNTVQGRALAMMQLVSKHSGEVVELDPRTQDWRLLDLKRIPAMDQALPVLFRTTSPKRQAITCSTTWNPVM